jgi:hypothetical protein
MRTTEIITEEEISPELQQLIDQATVAGNKMASSRSLRYQLHVPRKISVREDMKPDAELWTSTAEFRGDNSYTSAWAEWCYYNMPSWLAKEGKLYEVQPGARILNIGSDAAAIKIARLFGRNYSNASRYERLGNYPWKELKLYFDAIRYPARLKSSFTSRQNNILMSLWDVESTAWYNTNKLKFLRTVEINTREW